MLRKYWGGLAFAMMIVFTHNGLIANSYAAEITPQTSNERGIKVTATLQAIPADAKTWTFEVTLETHIQPLNDDLARSATLIVDGKQYLPLAWDGAPPGGHHRKGVLRFQATGPQPRSMELQIRLAGDTTPRSFKWSLK
ncbi:MAG: hypothetical protein Q7T38_06120 [Gallionella sp.]|nr:hypothetical protein [Gallionella sp.]